MIVKSLNVGGQDYQIEKMNAFEQFNVAKKLGTALMLLSTLQKREGTPPSADEFSRLLVAGTVNLSNEDTDFVNRVCLSKVKRQQPGGTGWAAVVEPRTGRFMFDDIDLKEMTLLVWGVVEAHHMMDFFYDPSLNLGQGNLEA